MCERAFFMAHVTVTASLQGGFDGDLTIKCLYIYMGVYVLVYTLEYILSIYMGEYTYIG